MQERNIPERENSASAGHLCRPEFPIGNTKTPAATSSGEAGILAAGGALARYA